MNLNNMSREELINELKKYMVMCTNSFRVEYMDYKTGKRNTASFNKGEYYYKDLSEGGMFIINNGIYFDVDDEE
jgi:hypothetical protein